MRDRQAPPSLRIITQAPTEEAPSTTTTNVRTNVCTSTRLRRPRARGASLLCAVCCLASPASGFVGPSLGRTLASPMSANPRPLAPRADRSRALATNVAAPPLRPGSPRGKGSVSMISSLFRWRNPQGDDEEEVVVNIEAPASNIRRISSQIVIDRPMDDVWGILTDYDRLAEYVPNLTQSRAIPVPPAEQARARGVRLFQEGAQTIIGFNFRASLTMDMEEVWEGEDEKLGQRRIKFKLVDSAMFNDFSGEWRLQCYSRMRTNCTDPETGGYRYTYSTKLFYMVTVKPKGPVPVAALEWRIREDVPINLKAVKRVSEALPWDCSALDAPPMRQIGRAHV